MSGGRPLPHAAPPHAHGRQNGGAKAKALHGPPAAAAAKREADTLRQEQRNAAIKRTRREKAKRASKETKRKADTLRQEQRKQKVWALRRAGF
jgi:hypothetical protein